MSETGTFYLKVENWSVTTDVIKTFTEQSEVKCATRHKASFLVFSVFPGLAIVINLVILAAVMRKIRILLRQSHVYVHVSSTLAGNVLFSLLSLLQIFSLYFNFGGHPNHPDPTVRGMVNDETSRWWPLHKSLLCGMFVIMCGNIGLLVDSIRHNTCSNLQTATGGRLHSKEAGVKKRKRIFNRLQKSYLTIALLWLIPLTYVAIPVMVRWNCAKICHCLSECFPSNHVIHQNDFKCSRIFPPLTNYWLSVIVISWFCGVVITFWLLKRSVAKVTKMWAHFSEAKCYEKKKFNQEDKTEQAYSFLSSNNTNIRPPETPISVDSNAVILDEENPISNNIIAPKSIDEWNDTVIPKRIELEDVGKSRLESDKNDSCLFFSTRIVSHRRMLVHLRNTKASTFSLRYVITLIVFFVVFTTPTMTLLACDILNPTLTLNMVLLNSCLVCPFIYCYVCPFILVKCLPGVKNSLSALLLSVYSSTSE